MEQQLLAGIPDNYLTVFDAGTSNKDISWEEKGKEFTLDGNRYDVAKTRIINGKTFLYCINDKKEEQVLKERSNAVKSGTDQNANTNNQPGHIVKFQINDCILFGLEKPTAAAQPDPQEYADLTVAMVSSFKKVITPPPNFNILQNFIL